MICSTEEFLLVLQNWITDSATVICLLRVGDDPVEPAIAFSLRGRIRGIDHSLPGFTFVIAENNLTVVNLSAWTEIGYADANAYPASENIDQAFSLVRPGAQIGLWTKRS